jgi:serine/threonine-protein kinase
MLEYASILEPDPQRATSLPAALVEHGLVDVRLFDASQRADVVLVPPIPRAVLSRPSEAGAASVSTSEQGLLSLLTVTLLGGEFPATLESALAQVAHCFGVRDCVLVGHPIRTPDPLLVRAVHASMHAGTTAITGGGMPDGLISDDPALSVLAAPAGAARDEPCALCLVADGVRRFSDVELDALRGVAQRVGLELAWTSAHARAVAELTRWRDSAFLHPRLGVLTRSALEQAFSSLPKVEHTLVMFDFVALKTVNERYGHEVGDAVLAHLADVLRSELGAQDIIGRFGGDELALVLRGSRLALGFERVKSLVSEVERRPFLHAEIEIPMLVKAGVTPIAADERGCDRAFRRAMAALAIAGRDRQRIAVRENTASALGMADTVGADTSAMGALRSGTTLGGMYRVLHEISSGAMGTVYRGEDLGLSRPVAIKVLRSDLAMNQRLVSQFRSEAATLASVRHRNLVQVYSIGSEGADVYFVMELVEGMPISEVIVALRRDGMDVDLEVVEEVVVEVADALDAIHAVGIIHRDVKPANILLDRVHDRAVLVDVGIARRQDDARDAAGTPGFAAPESFLEQKETAATDVYGLAATAYAMLTGEPPYGGDDVSDIVRNQLETRAAPPSQARPELSPAVDEVLFRALSADVSLRYASASAFAIALGRALSRSQGSGVVGLRRGRRANHDRSTFALVQPTGSPGEVRAPEQAAFAARGVVFRIAQSYVTEQLAGGDETTANASDERTRRVLSRTALPLGWEPLDDLSALFAALAAIGREAEKHVTAIGRSVVSATFARFLGADPRTLGPKALFRGAQSCWSRYFQWGQLAVADRGGNGITATLDARVATRFLLAFLSGFFARVAELGGARGVRVVAEGYGENGLESGARFDISWQQVNKEST